MQQSVRRTYGDENVGSFVGRSVGLSHSISQAPFSGGARRQLLTSALASENFYL